MSAALDVLAVLDDAFAELCRYGEPGNYVAADRLDQARAAVAELIEHNRIMRESLEKLARAPGCGCHPVCRCGDGDWSKLEIEGRMDEAQVALARVGGQP